MHLSLRINPRICGILYNCVSQPVPPCLYPWSSTEVFIYRQFLFSVVLVTTGVTGTLADSHPSPVTNGQDETTLETCNRDRKPNFNYDPGASYSDMVIRQGYTTELKAVIAAANYFNPISVKEDREYIGAIVAYCNRYYFTVKVGEPGQDQVTARIRIPKQATIVAFWHTHGSVDRKRKYFSDVDTQLVKSWKLPFYLSDYTGELKVFSPKDRVLSSHDARNLGLPLKYGYARGSFVRDEAGNKIIVAT